MVMRQYVKLNVKSREEVIVKTLANTRERYSGIFRFQQKQTIYFLSDYEVC